MGDDGHGTGESEIILQSELWVVRVSLGTMCQRNLYVYVVTDQSPLVPVFRIIT